MPTTDALTIPQYKRELGARLFRLALEWARTDQPPGTQADREQAIRDTKGRKRVVLGTRAASKIRAHLETASSIIVAARQRKARWGHGKATTPTPTIATRLDAWRTDAVHAAWTAAGYRYGAAGGSSLSIELIDPDHDRAYYYVMMQENRHVYKGKYKGWSASEDHHYIQVPRDWITRVRAAGLAIADGMLTLTASLDHMHGDIRIYRARWAVQGRGYRVQTEHGYLASSTDTFYHAATPEQALKGIKRKLKAEDQAQGAAHLSRSALEQLVQRFAAMPVTTADAHAVGACASGIAHWCRLCEISEQSISLERFYRAYRMQPHPIAKRVLERVIQRCT